MSADHTAAIVATDFGGPEVLELVEVPIAAPGPGEILLEVRAAGVNPIDWKLYSGTYGVSDRSWLPMRVGFEAAGVVAAVGEGAAGPAGPLAVGDEVIAYRMAGAYAQQVVIPGASAVPKPAELSFEQAGGLMLAGATAVHCLVATGTAAGDTVVVHGASGGVGLLLVQLAIARGARVIATASAPNHAVLEELGATTTTYGDGLIDRIRALAPDGVDVAIDVVGTDEALDTSLELVADRDRIAEIAAAPRGLAAGVRVLGGAPGADPGTEVRDRARLELTEMAAAGRLRIDVQAFPLADAADVHREAMPGHTRGKLVLVP
jgi:NADPH2:quinone reductase